MTTKRDKERRPAPDLVQREFTATGINQLWVADMTYIPTWAGFVYLAVVLFRFARPALTSGMAERHAWLEALLRRHLHRTHEARLNGFPLTSCSEKGRFSNGELLWTTLRRHTVSASTQT